MSFLVTRPESPEPAMALMSTWCSAAIFRTSGVDLRWSRSSTDSTAPLPPVASLTALVSAAAAADAAAGTDLGGAGDSLGREVPLDGTDDAGASGAGGAPAGVADF
jgi:hypothetical protein